MYIIRDITLYIFKMYISSAYNVHFTRKIGFKNEMFINYSFERNCKVSKF